MKKAISYLAAAVLVLIILAGVFDSIFGII